MPAANCRSAPGDLNLSAARRRLSCGVGKRMRTRGIDAVGWWMCKGCQPPNHTPHLTGAALPAFQGSTSPAAPAGEPGRETPAGTLTDPLAAHFQDAYPASAGAPSPSRFPVDGLA